MRSLALLACSMVTVAAVGVACDNDPEVLGTGAGATTGGGNNNGGNGGETTTANGGNGNNGNMGGGGAADGGNGGQGGQGGDPVVITTCAEDLAPQEGPNDIVISEVSIGNYIEVYNPTANTIDLGAVAYSAYQWCAQPSYPSLQSTASNIVLPANAYRTIPWPTLNVGDTTNGELALYLDNNYESSASVVDYVCWGTLGAAGTNRMDEAAGAGEWGGACAASTTNGVLRRVNTTNGNAAADWDSTATADPTNCDP